MPSWTSLRIVSFTSSSARCSLAQFQRLVQPLRDVDGLQQGDLLLGGQVGRVAGEVRERGRVVDLLHARRPSARRRAAGGSRTGSPCTRASRRRGPRCGVMSSRVVASTQSAAPGPVVAEPTRTRLTPRTHDNLLAAANPAYLLDDADRADRAVAPVTPRDQQHARVVGFRLDRANSRTRRRRALGTGGLSGVHRGTDIGVGEVQRHDHSGQYHLVIQRQDREHQFLAHVPSHLPFITLGS